MFKRLFPVTQKVLLTQFSSAFSQAKPVRSYGIYEPDYLDSLKPKFPQYDVLNVQIKGYDYPVLEMYQRFLYSVAEYLDMDVSECYALPPTHTTVQRLKPASTVVDSEYKLTTYERNIEINDLNAPMYPFFLRIAQSALPEGVSLSITEHTQDLEDLKYVPDKDLLDLRAQLDGMQGNAPSKKK